MSAGVREYLFYIDKGRKEGRKVEGMKGNEERMKKKEEKNVAAKNERK